LELPPAPEPEDFYASLNSYLEVILRATDKDGLTGEASVLLQPALVKIKVATYPAGLEVLVDEESVIDLEEVWSWSEHDLQLKAENQPPYIFASWSDGITSAERIVRLNMTEPSFVANYCVEDGGPCASGTESCCNYICNSDRKCAEEQVADHISTEGPEATDETTSPTDNPSTFEFHASNPPTSLEQEDKASNIAASHEPQNSPVPVKKSMRAAGEAILITVVLVVLVLVACVGLFLLQKRKSMYNQRCNSIAGKWNFLDVEKLPTDIGELSSDDGHSILQTSSC
jgi:hypothetical protein